MAGSRRVALAGLLLLPAGLTAFFAFNSGGFFPGPPAYVAVVLCIVVVLRVMLAERPGEGWGPWMSGVTGALTLYALLTLLSGLWSHAPGRTLVEFDRALVYLLSVVLFGSLAGGAERLRWVLRALALAIVAICLCGLITRLLPHLWPTTADPGESRLGFPLTYSNALGLMGAYGVVLCLQLSSDLREPVAARVLAAAALPIVAVTVYFTFSRGALAAIVIGVAVIVVLGRPKALVSVLLATAPTTVAAIKVAYGASLLSGPTPTTASAAAQGQHVAVAVVICALVAGGARAVLAWRADRRLVGLALPRPTPSVRRATWSALPLAAVIAAFALQPAIAHQYQRFIRPPAPGSRVDVRTRLSDPSSDGRVAYWRVAWHQFERTPVLGHGAGSYEIAWARSRPTAMDALDAHSLYLETLAELGILGFVLLAAVIVAVLVRAARRARDADRLPYATVFALVLVWALHAGIDWDWEMPAITVPIFALAGIALARPATPHATPLSPARATRALPLPHRTLTALGCLLLAVVPATLWLSQRRLDQATAAFANDNCSAAASAASSSVSILAVRPEPYEVLSYCDARRGKPGQAIATIRKAVSLDPENWNYRYDLAVMKACAGRDPRPDTNKAAALNPLEPLVQQALQTFNHDTPAEWKQDGENLADAFTTL